MATTSAGAGLKARLQAPEGAAKKSDAPEAAEGSGGMTAALVPVAGIVLLLVAGAVFKDDIKAFVEVFITAIESYGPLGYAAYAGLYTALEVLAVPTIPLALAAGVAFGPVPGTIVSSLSGTLAATIAFLIARYAARDKVSEWARTNSRFAAIDRAIAKDGFKFVTLLRLSPLFPFAAGNYLYGLTSVNVWAYAAGTWIGNLPGTYAYVSAGALANAALGGGEGIGPEPWQVGLGLVAAVLAISYIGRLAKDAIEEADREGGGEGAAR